MDFYHSTSATRHDSDDEAMFVIPEQLGMFDDVFSRWESITRNYVARQGFTDAKDKVEYIENLLGETEKLIWIQWRMQYSQEYQALIATGDGREGTQNILSQIRRVFSLEDPTQRSTAIQDAAYRDLERLTCSHVKDVVQYMNDYWRLAVKTGRLYVSTELSEKFWFKMPEELGKRMKEAFERRYPGVVIGVLPRILFAYKFLEEECKDAAYKRSLKDLPFCRQIPIPGNHVGTFSVLELCLRDILCWIKPLESDRSTRLNVINRLATSLGSIESLKGAEIRPFGSFVSDLYTKWGDLDISVQFPRGSYESMSRTHKKNLLRDIMRALRKNGVTHYVEFIPNARVPLLKFQSTFPSISCDVSIDNHLGLIKSKVLLWIGQIDERFRDMVLLIKEWAKTQNINDPKSGTLNSYSLCLLIIFHFQTCEPAILPPLMEIYQGNLADDVTGMGSTYERQIEDVCAANIRRFRSQSFRKTNKSSLCQLLISFFYKFCDIKSFSLEYAICTYTGRLERIRAEKSYDILVEDPFERPDNAARAVGLRQLSTISNAFMDTYLKLSRGSALADRKSLLAILIRPTISLQLGLRSQVNYNAQENGTQHRWIQHAGYATHSPSQELFKIVPRPERQERHQLASSLPRSLQRQETAGMQLREMWRPKFQNI